MYTVVYQSFRTTDVPHWLGQCMRSVKDWSLARGFDYAFLDDQFFDYVPEWYKERVGGHVLPISDLARLEVAREFLARGYERTIWVDADVLIFRPENFSIGITEGYAFCQELWIEPQSDGQVLCSRRVNNAVSVFTRGLAAAVEFFADAARTYVRNKTGPVGPREVSTNLLSALYSHVFFPLLKNIGRFSPPVLLDVGRGGGPLVEVYRRQFGHPVYAANLCSSFRNQSAGGVTIDDAFYTRAVERLLETQGEVVNGHTREGPSPA